MYQNLPSYIQYNNNNSFSNSEYYATPRHNMLHCGTDKMQQPIEFARAYIIRQPYSELLPLDVALARGSVFSNINLDYPRP